MKDNKWITQFIMVNLSFILIKTNHILRMMMPVSRWINNLMKITKMKINPYCEFIFPLFFFFMEI